MADILIVDDELSINELVKRNLELVGHHVTQAFDGYEALDRFRNGRFDIILLDVMLPGIDGFTLVHSFEGTPVIFMTAKGNVSDRLMGLTSGAEDYLVKPFDIMELIARINIVLRRNSGSTRRFTISNVTIDMEKKQAFIDNEPVELTPQEFELMEVLILNRNLAMSRDKLLEQAWGYDYEGDTRTVDVHIQKLRKKLGLEDYIKTVYKLGYRLEV